MKSVFRNSIQRQKSESEEMKLLSSLDVEKSDEKQEENTHKHTSDSPLFIAAFLGQFEIAKQLLSHNPDIAGRLNSGGSTALHVAAAKGYVEIVKELVLVNKDLCFVLDGDGRSPLHLAAIKGRVGVLTELVRLKPEATRVVTRDGGETCLHLCVGYNRLEALKVLLEIVKEDDKFVNWKDQFGNTILHIAVAKKQIEIIKHLLVNTNIQVNSRNANGFTALDILSHGPRDLRDMDIKHCLTQDKATIVESLSLVVPEQKDLPEVDHGKKPIDWLARKRSALMIVASLIATVAYQAALSPPGGVWQDDNLEDSNGNPVSDPHMAGKAVLAYTIPGAYGQFMIFNTIAFLSSLSIILVQVSGLPMRKRRLMWAQMAIMWIAMSSLTFTYFIAFIQLTPDRDNNGVLRQVTKIAVLGWLSLIGLVFIGNVIRVIQHLLQKYWNIKQKEKDQIYNSSRR